MTKNWITLISLLCLCGHPTVIPAAAAVADAPAETTRNQKESTAGKQEDEIRKFLIDLAGAINTGDAPGVAACWLPESIFIDQSGQKTQGRAALQERFAKVLPQRNSAKVELHPEQISLPSENVALVIGSVSHKTGAIDLPASRFSIALTKQDGRWMISQAMETSLPASASDHLRELEWMVGRWQVEQPQNPPELEVQWSGGHNFLMSKCTSHKDGEAQVDTQIIGWDPRNKIIVSWHFNHDGGFGYGKWSKEDNRWLVNFTGVSSDGCNTSATNVFSPINQQEFTWQSADQVIDGRRVAGSAQLKVKKLSQ